jgi:hypothetical protein
VIKPLKIAANEPNHGILLRDQPIAWGKNLNRHYEVSKKRHWLSFKGSKSERLPHCERVASVQDVAGLVNRTREPWKATHEKGIK